MNDDDELIMLAGNDTGGGAPAVALTHHRQRGESTKAHQAFRSWLELGPDRSLPRVAQACAKHVSLLKRWSSRWSWVARLTAYEAELAELDRQADIKAADARAVVRAARRAGLEDDQWELGELMKGKARKMLAFPLATTNVQTDTATGQQTTVVKPGPWRFRDVATLFVAANRLQRLAVDLPTDKVEATGKDDASLVPLTAGVPIVNIICEGPPTPDDPMPPEGEVEPETDGA